MNQTEFGELVASTVASINKLLVVKGGEYANDADRLANFKRGAALTGATPLQVAFIYASKHYDGIASFVRTAAEGKVRPSSEPIEGRFDDLINYCLLMKALVKESQRKESPGKMGQGTYLIPGQGLVLPEGAKVNLS
jgi:hypothetical protein